MNYDRSLATDDPHPARVIVRNCRIAPKRGRCVRQRLGFARAGRNVRIVT